MLLASSTDGRIKMFSMVAIDLDGTLLNSENQLDDKTIQALETAVENGIDIVIATGRAHFDVWNILENTSLYPWVISANGAAIHSPDRELYISVPLPKDTGMEVLSWLHQQEFYYEAFTEKAIYTPHNSRELLQIEQDRIKSANPHADTASMQKAAERQYSQTGFSFIESYLDLHDMNISLYNILAVSFIEEKRQAGIDHFKYREDLTLVTSGDHNFEVEHTGASKGLALERLATELAVPLKDTAAIGDNYNDISMLETAGYAVAIGNAVDEVKTMSDHIVGTNDEYGVAEALTYMMNS